MNPPGPPPPPFPPYYLAPPPPPPPPFTSLPPPPPPPPPLEMEAPDLSTALSTLTSLISLTDTTLKSLSPFLPEPPSSSLIPCPFDPTHLLPHSSLFSHYLSCPSSLTPISDPDSLILSLKYPQTLHSTPKTSVTQNLQEPTSTELSFSLEEFLNLPLNLFYSSCPGAVIVDPAHTNRSSFPMLTLPRQLSAESADVGHSDDLDEKGFLLESIRIFPSEFWAVRNEVEGWVDYPSSYSCRLLRSILTLRKRGSSCLPTWMIENSPKYGVVIDLAMRDHIGLLFKLCLRAIVWEAISLSHFLSNERADKELGWGEKMFDCPVLLRVMMWLGAQLSILYGEKSGNSFAINMLKQCILDSALKSSCFPVVERAQETSESKELDCESAGAFGNSAKEETGTMVDGSVQTSVIFICQVAAAVAALHERSWLEEKIQKLRDARQLNAYQRFIEHENITTSAHEQRQKRSNYRPVIEHDGVLSKRTHNQEPNRIRTVEELLAEERDYKRRRMSFRGKKVKRTTTQVMRDIINEFMDEIKLTQTEGTEATAFGSSFVHNIASDVIEPTKVQSALGLPREEPRVSGTRLYSGDGHQAVNSENYNVEPHEKNRRHSGSHREHADDVKRSKRERHDRRDNSKSHYQEKVDQHFHESARKQDVSEVPGETITHSSSGNLRNTYEKKSRRREESRHDSELRHKDASRHGSELKHKHSRKKHQDHRLDSVHDGFEDRYDPSNRCYDYEYK